jgi:hypothetical protein
MFAAALSHMAVYIGQSSRQDAAQAAQHGRHALEGARLQLWRSARPAQAGKLTNSFDYEWYIIAAFVVKSPTPIKNGDCRQSVDRMGCAEHNSSCGQKWTYGA